MLPITFPPKRVQLPQPQQIITLLFVIAKQLGANLHHIMPSWHVVPHHLLSTVFCWWLTEHDASKEACRAPHLQWRAAAWMNLKNTWWNINALLAVLWLLVCKLGILQSGSQANHECCSDTLLTLHACTHAYRCWSRTASARWTEGSAPGACWAADDGSRRL